MSEFKIGAGTTEDQLQQFFAYLFAQSSTGSATTGVLSGLAAAQTTTASASVLVNIGAAVSQSSLTAGADVLVNNAQKTIDVLGANPMGAVARNDLIVFNPSSAAIQLVVGTPNVTPTDPSAPTGSVVLARLRHAGSATTVPAAKIDDLRVMTTLATGTVPRVATGIDSITPVAANTPTRKDLTFPVGRFSAPPVVQATLLTTVPGTTATGISVDNVTATGFSVWLTRTNTTGTGFHWLALQE